MSSLNARRRARHLDGMPGFARAALAAWWCAGQGETLIYDPNAIREDPWRTLDSNPASTTYNPNVVTYPGLRVTRAPELSGTGHDLTGSAALNPGPSTIGATTATAPMLVHERGRHWWRFTGDGSSPSGAGNADFLTIPATLAHDSFNMSVFMLVRHHSPSAKSALYSVGLNGTGAGTAANTQGAMMTVNAANTLPPQLAAVTRIGTATQGIVGNEPCVLGMVSRTTALGGARTTVNYESFNVAQIPAPQRTGSDAAGGEIGRYAYSGISPAGTDIGEIFSFSRGFTDAESDQFRDWMLRRHNILPYAGCFYDAGDSIFQAVRIQPNFATPSVIFTPSAYRRVNGGVSGDKLGTGTGQAATLTNRASTADACLVPGGRNVIAIEIGGNDWSILGTTIYLATASGGSSPLGTIANGTDWVNIALADYVKNRLAAGWTEVWVWTPYMRGASVSVPIKAARAALTTNVATFMAACLAGSGQTYEGRVKVVNTADWQVDGAYIWRNGSVDTPNDEDGLTARRNFIGDNTHLRYLGLVEQASAFGQGWGI